MAILSRVLGTFLPFHSRRRHQWTGTRGRARRNIGKNSPAAMRSYLRQQRRAGAGLGDVEASVLGRRQLEPDAVHSADEMYLVPGEEAYDYDDDESRPIFDADDAKKAYMPEILAAMKECDAIPDEEFRKANVIRHLCMARSGAELYDRMDYLIDEEWLAGKMALPGNIYSVLALDFLPHISCTDGCATYVLRQARQLGMIFIILIQIVGPPMIFYQYGWHSGFEDEERLDWTAFKENFPSLDDWYPEEGTPTTKFLGLLFVICFVLNSLFCWLDEGNSWTKLLRLFNNLDRNNHMEGAHKSFLRLGTFVNAWVVLWLCIDVYFCLGVATTAQDVLMDALALSFMFNLDDIGGDLGFLEEDDWPGLQLSWFHDEFYRLDVSTKFRDIDDYDDDLDVCNLYQTCVSLILLVFVFAVPVMYSITPFKSLEPDDAFYKTLTEETFDARIANMTMAVLSNLGMLVSSTTSLPTVSTTSLPVNVTNMTR